MVIPYHILKQLVDTDHNLRTHVLIWMKVTNKTFNKSSNF